MPLCLASTYKIQYISPAFHGNALEDSEHGEDDTVEGGDPVVRSGFPFLARGAIRTYISWLLTANLTIMQQLLR